MERTKIIRQLWVGVGGGCFPEYSRVLRARSTHNSFQFYPPPTPTHVSNRGSAQRCQELVCTDNYG